MKKRYLLWTLLFAVNITAFSQRHCGTINKQNQIEKDNPSLKTDRLTAEQEYLERIQFNETNRFKKTGDTYVIPVVVHVIAHPDFPQENISDEVIQSQIDILNEDFSSTNSDGPTSSHPFFSIAAGDWNIRFELATVDPNGNATNGIVRTSTRTVFDLSSNIDDVHLTSEDGSDAWDNDNYMNIWVLDIYEDGSPANTLGYAYLPSSKAGVGYRDGIVCQYWAFGDTEGLSYEVSSANKGRTMTHEVGHYLGLLHIWGDDDCGNDLVDDTPPQEDPNYGDASTFSHPWKQEVCTGNTTGEMYMNFMGYGDDEVLTMFTAGQRTRCEDQISTFRPDLLNAQSTTALFSSDKTNKLNVYPNPANDNLTIEGIDVLEKVEIFNSLGILKVQSINSQGLRIISLDVSGLSSGSYIVKTTDGNTISTSSFIKN